MGSQPMDHSAFKGHGKGKASGNGGHSKGGGKSDNKRFEGNCNNCGKSGHKKSECRAPGGGAHKGSGKGGGKDNAKKMACFKCGMTNHIAKYCRAPQAKIDAYKKSGGRNLKELDESSQQPDE